MKFRNVIDMQRDEQGIRRLCQGSCRVFRLIHRGENSKKDVTKPYSVAFKKNIVAQPTDQNAVRAS